MEMLITSGLLGINEEIMKKVIPVEVMNARAKRRCRVRLREQ